MWVPGDIGQLQFVKYIIINIIILIDKWMGSIH